LVSTLKTADVYLTKISDAKRLSNNETLVKYLDGLKKPITNTEILEIIVANLNDKSSMEAEINKREEVEKGKEKAILDAIKSIK
jgi:hypothetical protein